MVTQLISIRLKFTEHKYTACHGAQGTCNKSLRLRRLAIRRRRRSNGRGRAAAARHGIGESCATMHSLYDRGIHQHHTASESMRASAGTEGTSPDPD